MTALLCWVYESIESMRLLPVFIILNHVLAVLTIFV